MLFGGRVAACAWMQTAELLAHFLPSLGSFVQVLLYKRKCLLCEFSPHVVR